MKHIASFALLLTFLLAGAATARAHCQVPCGIYDDKARIHAMREDVTTIGKAAKLITELSKKEDALSRNQLVRWVQTKEQHANRIMSVVSEYFLAQKIKPAPKSDKQAWQSYIRRLVAAHDLIRAAMKTKQTVDPKDVDALAKAVDAFGSHFAKK